MNVSFNCHECNVALKKQFSIEKHKAASTLYLNCLNCEATKCCSPDLDLEIEQAWMKNPASRRFKDERKDCVSGARFEVNKKLYLAMQGIMWWWVDRG